MAKKKRENRPVEIDLSGNDARNCWSLVTGNKIYPSLSQKKEGNCVILMLAIELLVMMKLNNSKIKRLECMQPPRELCQFTKRFLSWP